MKIAAASHTLLQRVNRFIPAVLNILTDWDKMRARVPPCNAAEYMAVAHKQVV
jgi:hypothetical protein